MQRLFDHEQRTSVELPEHVHVVERVCRIRVDREQDVRIRLADGADAFDVEAWLDLELDAPVSLIEISSDRVEERVRRRLDPHRDAALDAVPRPAEVLAE